MLFWCKPYHFKLKVKKPFILVLTCVNNLKDFDPLTPSWQWLAGEIFRHLPINSVRSLWVRRAMNIRSASLTDLCCFQTCILCKILGEGLHHPCCWRSTKPQHIADDRLVVCIYTPICMGSFGTTSIPTQPV